MKSPSSRGQPASPVQLGALGCAGALLGMLLATCGLSMLIVWMAMGTSSLPPPTSDPSQPDIVITVQEAYFTQLLAQSMPAGWVEDLRFDMQPGNRLVLSGRIKTTFFGQTLEGDLSATVLLDARDGNLVIEIKDVNVSGFALSGIGATFIHDLSERISQIINEQIKAGLGPGAFIMSVVTDDQQLVIRARWQ